MADRQDLRAFHPFARLNRLLEGVAPGVSPLPDGAPVLLSIGEPQQAPPDFVAEELAAAAAGWSRYPPPRGDIDYLTACRDWLVRRYDLPDGLLDPARHFLPLPGTREGLFFAVQACTPLAEPGAAPPAVLVPNPCYHVYAGAAAAAGGEPVFLPATAENGFLPDYGAADPAVLARTALAVLCSPSNPQGMAASLPQLEDLIGLARQQGFPVFFDECYAEIYSGAPPPGALQAAVDLGGSLEGLLVFHSLSKRSNAAGLRCGFVAGDPKLIDALDGILRFGGAGVPLPIMAAGARLWRDQAHAAEIRAFYQENFDIAGRILGNRFGFYRPDGGFFLWLDVGDGEAAAKKLWQQAGIKVLPGAYMCRPDGAGTNHGSPYIRVALVFDAAVTEAALGRLSEIL